LHPSTLAKRVHFLIFLVFIAFYFYGLGLLPLLGPDEPRYTQIGREMLLNRDLITPTLGGHTWFEKPALLYWMVAASFKVFGVSEWSARLAPAVCGVMTIIAVWWTARAVERSTFNTEWSGYASWSALLAASCLGFVVFSRGTSFDIVITMTTAWALGFFFRSDLAKEQRTQKLLLAGFYCCTGLSLLAKGLVGLIIPFGVVFTYFLLRRTFPNRIVWTSLLWGLPLVVAVSAIWYGPVIYKHGWTFIDEFFIQHHFARYTSNKYHHPQPIYFYPAILIMLAVPWTPFLIDALISTTRWSWRGRDSSTRLHVFMIAWLLFPVLFFSFSGSKLPGYILPVLPAALLLIAASVTRSQRSGWTIKTTGLFWLLLGLGGVFYLLRMERVSLNCALLVGTPFVIAGVLSLFWRRSLEIPVLTVAGSVLLAVAIILNCFGPRLVRRESTRDLLLLADQRGYSNVPVLAQRGDDRSAEFYASGRVIYGVDGEVIPLDEAPSIIAATRSRKERILAFTALEHVTYLQGLPGVEVIGNNGKLALVLFY
jgi:4-amino-4-deoxy-L-arabinose transferase-like glycosyltransferase